MPSPTLRVGTVACFSGWLLYSVYTLLRSPEAAFKRRLMGVLEHPELPLGTPLVLHQDMFICACNAETVRLRILLLLSVDLLMVGSGMLHAAQAIVVV